MNPLFMNWTMGAPPGMMLSQGERSPQMQRIPQGRPAMSVQQAQQILTAPTGVRSPQKTALKKQAKEVIRNASGVGVRSAAQAAAAQAAQAAQAGNPPPGAAGRWQLPITLPPIQVEHEVRPARDWKPFAAIGAVLIIGGVIYIATRKKK